MRALSIAVMLIPAIAYGEPAKHQTTFDIKLDDPSGSVTSAAVTAAIGATVDGWWRKPGRMKAKLVDKFVGLPVQVPGGFAQTGAVPASPSIDSGLSSDEIARVMKANASAFKGCYQDELKKRPGLSGKIVVRFRIEADGRVSSASVDTASSTLASDAVGACIAARVRKLKFPAKAVANVTFPFIFHAQN